MTSRLGTGKSLTIFYSVWETYSTRRVTLDRATAVCAGHRIRPFLAGTVCIGQFVGRVTAVYTYPMMSLEGSAGEVGVE